MNTKTLEIGQKFFTADGKPQTLINKKKEAAKAASFFLDKTRLICYTIVTAEKESSKSTLCGVHADPSWPAPCEYDEEGDDK